MRTFSFLLAWFATVSMAAAQQPATPQVSSAAGFTQADSVAALQQYFQHKRHRGTILTVGALAAPVAVGVAASNEQDALSRGIAYVAGVPMASAVPLGFWLFYRQYNLRHEQQAVLALQSGKLSPKLRAKLKPVYFRR